MTDRLLPDYDAPDYEEVDEYDRTPELPDPECLRCENKRGWVIDDYVPYGTGLVPRKVWVECPDCAIDEDYELPF